MNLQLALTISGLVILGLVFVLSRSMARRPGGEAPGDSNRAADERITTVDEGAEQKQDTDVPYDIARGEKPEDADDFTEPAGIHKPVFSSTGLPGEANNAANPGLKGSVHRGGAPPAVAVLEPVSGSSSSSDIPDLSDDLLVSRGQYPFVADDLPAPGVTENMKARNADADDDRTSPSDNRSSDSIGHCEVGEPEPGAVGLKGDDAIPQTDTAPDSTPLSELASVAFHYPEITGFQKLSQIDYWVRIYGERDIGRENLLAQYRESASRLTKPSRIFGMRLSDQSWRDIEYESEDVRFGDVVVTIQLADRNGAITRSELGNFTTLVSNISEGTGRGFNFMASVESALAQGRVLYDFVQFYDAVFVINVRPAHAETFAGNAILRCATQLGLEPDMSKFFVRNKAVGKKKICLYSLANSTDSGEFDFEHIRELNTHGVTFFTRPAVNRSPGAVFSEMADTAKAFAARIKGEISTPSGNDLSQEEAERLRVSIEKTAQLMEESGIDPGSDEAMRIFSTH